MAQILGHVPMLTAKLEHRAIQIVHGSKPEGGEVQRGRPPLGPTHQVSICVVVQPETAAVGEQLACLRSRERQLARA